MIYAYADTPVGPFFVAGDGERIALTSFTTGHQTRTPEEGWRHDPGALRSAVDEIEAYFAGTLRRFTLPLALGGTAFQRAVWDHLLTLPFGARTTYAAIAHAIGRPRAVRAVGAANGANVLPLVVPCHRVVGSDGSLTGFGGGLPTKRFLLDFEGSVVDV